MNVSRVSTDAIQEIGEFANKHPLLLLQFLALYLLVAGLIWLLWEGAQSDRARERVLLETRQQERDQTTDLLAQVVAQLQQNAPTKMDARERDHFKSMITANDERLRGIESRQDAIMRSLENIRLSLDGKTGR